MSDVATSPVAAPTTTPAVASATTSVVAVTPAPAVVQPEKKKPGRPRKKTDAPPENRRGIVPAPMRDENRLELVYSAPAVFKKLMALYKKFDVAEIDIYFWHTRVEFHCDDHPKKSTIYTTIECANVQQYYCASPIQISIARGRLEKILSTLSAQQYEITFMLGPDWQRKLDLAIKSAECGITSVHSIDIARYSQCMVGIPLDMAVNAVGVSADAASMSADTCAGDRANAEHAYRAYDDADYPIKFKLTSKHLKSQINTICKMSKTFAIMKSPDTDLQFQYDKSYESYDSAKIQLEAATNDEFAITLDVSSIKPFSDTVIGDQVQICCDRTARISFTADIDACTRVVVYTALACAN